ncbi:MAG: ATP-binding protein [Pseudomonadota bacterium]
MTSSIATPPKPVSAKPWLSPSWGLLLGASLCAVLLVTATVPMTRAAAGSAALTLCFLIVGLRLRQRAQTRQEGLGRKAFQSVLGKDPAPCFLTDAQGLILAQNAAAQERFAAATGQAFAGTLQTHYASPGAVVFRLQRRIVTLGSAQEQVFTTNGHLRLSAHQLAPDRILWRLEECPTEPAVPWHGAGLSLPIATADASGAILSVNDALAQVLGKVPQRLDEMMLGPILDAQEQVIATPNGPRLAVLTAGKSPQAPRELYLLPSAAEPAPALPLAEFETVPVPLAKFSAKGQLIAANAAARLVLQLPRPGSEMIHDLFEGLGRPLGDWLDDIVQDRAPSRSEVLRARGLTGEVFLQVTLRRMVEQGQRGVLAVLQDATALKTLEAQFVQSQKMQAIGQLAGGVAHDFNNLLTAISGHCDLLLLRHNREDFDYADLVQIHQNANRAAALVNQLLAFSRKQTLKPERLDLADLLSDLAHLLNRLVGEKVQLHLTHAHGLGPIRADKRQLEQVLMNLVVNARDAMPMGGAIKITTQPLTLTTPLVRDNATVAAGDYAVIGVADTGTGIAPDLLSKIFEPFYTTKKLGEGTGLGLSTAYGIVKQSGGFIFVDSVVGQGTQFHLYFPLHPGPVEGAAAPAKKVVLRQGEGVILLVEDEAPVRAFASRALRLRGYTVLEAATAEEALTTLADRALRIDLFLTDVVMPGMDGPSWVNRALEDRPDVKVIFMSGYAEEALCEQQARIPNSVFLAKPFSLSDLTATVQAQLQ